MGNHPTLYPSIEETKVRRECPMGRDRDKPMVAVIGERLRLANPRKCVIRHWRERDFFEKGYGGRDDFPIYLP